MKSLTSIFLKGLAAVLPLAFTLYVLYWMFTSAENLIGGGLRKLLPEGVYITGMGLAIGVALILVVGILTKAWLFRFLLHMGEALIERIPVVKTLYGAVRDLLSFFSESHEESLNQAVLVELAEGVRLLGFVTREDLSQLLGGAGGGEGAGESVAVYLPMSYQIGGFTVFVPRDKLSPLDISIEDAMRFALTAGIVKAKQPT